MISLELPDKPGQLLHLTKALSDRGINITTVYGTAMGGSSSRLLLNASDPDRALEVLKAELGIK